LMLRMATDPTDVPVEAHGDVDFLSEQEFYDPNTIGSMLKHWLRELPEPMVPYKIQHALGAELQRDNPYYNVIGQATPQKLRRLWMATYFSLVCSMAHTAEDHTPLGPREPEPPLSPGSSASVDMSDQTHTG
jgi:hypothetical protein